MGAAGVTAGAAVAGAGVSAYSALSKGSGGQSSSTSSNAPWAPQQGPDENALSQAGLIEQNRLAAGPYTGEMVAGPNSGETNAEQGAFSFNQGTGSQLPYQVADQAQMLSGATQPYVSNASNIAASGNQTAGSGGLYGTLKNYGTGAQGIQGASPGLSSALNSAAIQGANSLSGFSNDLQSVANEGLGNPTSQIEGNVQNYMNSAPVQGELNSTNAAINQTLNESTLPGLNQTEASAGGLNSSRAGMAQGMAQQAAATSEGQADANIENNAYNTGMSTATNLYDTGLQQATSAGMFGYNDEANLANTQSGQQIGLGEANASNELGAANSGLTYGLNNTATELSANNQLGNASSMGITAAGDAINDAGANYNLGATAGQLQQAGQQAADTNNYDVWGNSNTYDQNVLQNYFGITSTNLGSQGTGYQQSQVPVNALGSALGAATAANGLYQNYTNQQNAYGATAANYADTANDPWGDSLSVANVNAPLYTDTTSTF